MITYTSGYTSSGITKYAKIDDNGTLFVGMQPVYGTSHVHLHTNISASASFILIDLSDTINYDHLFSNYITLDNLFINIDADNQADYIVNLGYLKDVNTTGGTFVHLIGVNGDKVAGKSKELTYNPFPNGPRMQNGFVTTSDILISSDYASTNPLPSTLDTTTSNVFPSDGDVVLRVTRNAGSFNLAVTMGYQSN